MFSSECLTINVHFQKQTVMFAFQIGTMCTVSKFLVSCTECSKKDSEIGLGLSGLKKVKIKGHYSISMSM